MFQNRRNLGMKKYRYPGENASYFTQKTSDSIFTHFHLKREYAEKVLYWNEGDPIEMEIQPSNNPEDTKILLSKNKNGNRLSCPPGCSGRLKLSYSWKPEQKIPTSEHTTPLEISKVGNNQALIEFRKNS